MQWNTQCDLFIQLQTMFNNACYMTQLMIDATKLVSCVKMRMLNPQSLEIRDPGFPFYMRTIYMCMHNTMHIAHSHCNSLCVSCYGTTQHQYRQLPHCLLLPVLTLIYSICHSGSPWFIKWHTPM